VGHKAFFVLEDLTPLTSCKADKVGTQVFTLRLGIMPGLPSSMMPPVPH